MRKNKGFTLVEVIAVIALLGVLSFIVVISVNSVQGKMKESYYEKQSDLIILAAKDYYGDKRSALPKENYAIEEVTVSSLVNQKYLDPVKGYQNDNCNFDTSKVEVFKIDQGEYRYRVNFECENYQGGSGNQKNPAPEITITPEDGTKSNKNIPITIKVEDDNLDVFRYSIKKDNNVIKTSGYIAYQQENYKETIKDSGIYQVEVMAIDKNWNRSTKTVSYRIYKEQADLEVSIVSDKKEYPGLKPTVTIEAKTKAEDVTIVKTEVVAKQGTKVQDTKSKEGLETTFPWDLGTNLNGLKYDYTVTVTDDYGNKTSKSKSYTVYAECTGSNRKETGRGSYGSCSGSCGTGTMYRSIYYEDKLTGKQCSNGSDSASCNTGIDCCGSGNTSTTVTTGSCNTTCGSGQKKITTIVTSKLNGQQCGEPTVKYESCQANSNCCNDGSKQTTTDKFLGCDGTSAKIQYQDIDTRNKEVCKTSVVYRSNDSRCSGGSTGGSGGGSTGGGSSCIYREISRGEQCVVNGSNGVSYNYPYKTELSSCHWDPVRSCTWCAYKDYHCE